MGYDPLILPYIQRKHSPLPKIVAYWLQVVFDTKLGPTIVFLHPLNYLCAYDLYKVFQGIGSELKPFQGF